MIHIIYDVKTFVFKNYAFQCLMRTGESNHTINPKCEGKKHLCTNMHTADKTWGLYGRAVWISSLYKGTLFNLLHTLNHGSSKETCPYSCGHNSLKCSSTAVSTAEQHRARGWRPLIMNESIPHQGYDYPKSPQNQTQAFRRAQRAFLHNKRRHTVLSTLWNADIVFHKIFVMLSTGDP